MRRATAVILAVVVSALVAYAASRSERDQLARENAAAIEKIEPIKAKIVVEGTFDQSMTAIFEAVSATTGVRFDVNEPAGAKVSVKIGKMPLANFLRAMSSAYELRYEAAGTNHLVVHVPERAVR